MVIVFPVVVEVKVMVDVPEVKVTVEEANQLPPMEWDEPEALNVAPEVIFMLPSQESPEPPELMVTDPPGLKVLLGQMYSWASAFTVRAMDGEVVAV